MSQSLQRDRDLMSKKELEEQRARDQAARERRDAAELATKRVVFSDACLGLGIGPMGGPRGPTVLEVALRHYVKHCDAHIGPAAELRHRFGEPSMTPRDRDITFTPASAIRHRQQALRALFLLSPSEQELHVRRDYEAALTHHALVTQHERRCTHSTENGDSTWQTWTAGDGSRRTERCTTCLKFRDLPPRFENIWQGRRVLSNAPLAFQGLEVQIDEVMRPDTYRIEQGGRVLRIGTIAYDALRRELDANGRMYELGSELDSMAEEPAPPSVACRHRYIAFNLTFDEASGPAGRSSMRCAACGQVQDSLTVTGVDLARSGDRTVVATWGPGPAADLMAAGQMRVTTATTMEELLAHAKEPGLKSSNSDPAATPDPGKAPPES